MVSIEDLYKDYGERLYNLLLRMLGDVDDALDALQQTFLRAHRAFGSFRKDSHPYTWLYRIAVNCAYTMLERRRRRRLEMVVEHQNLLHNPVNEETDASEHAAKTERVKIVQQAIMKLPEDLRAAVLLRDIEQLSYDEVARILDVPLGTVKSRVHRARELLKNHLKCVLGEEFVAE